MRAAARLHGRPEEASFPAEAGHAVGDSWGGSLGGRFGPWTPRGSFGRPRSRRVRPGGGSRVAAGPIQSAGPAWSGAGCCCNPLFVEVIGGDTLGPALECRVVLGGDLWRSSSGRGPPPSFCVIARPFRARGARLNGGGCSVWVAGPISSCGDAGGCCALLDRWWLGGP
ncbi:hypothetical protein NDU88_005977 [Pleurodeles waltl]|uniref:Uncharacterized protein n=1 Tax=Pleurodeles waltl TaxID=8319 RepID=A0AAV7MXV5_PLEWA|nr:hypothetical protein NDU88_005977 [Pleurodeles waltl]